MEHLTDQQLNDYVDGSLDSEEQNRVEVHIGACATCRADVDVLRSVLANVHALPAGVAPERDLLAGIHQAIDADQVVARSWGSRPLHTVRVPLAAAAIVLIIATALVTRLFDRTGSVAVAPEPNGSSVLVSRELNALQGKYESAIAELEQLVEAQRAQLSPATIRLLEDNLRVIDRALRESQEALQADPTNEMVNEMLWSTYEKKLELLRRATTVVST